MSKEDVTLVGFDLETTGIDVERDRIVTASLGDFYLLVNPGVEIPEEATAVHGISNETAKASGKDPLIALALLYDRLCTHADQGDVIVAYNASYDFTLLDRELRRHLDLRIPAGIVIFDPFVYDKNIDPYRKGSRKLEAVAAHYGVSLGDAHNSAADAQAAVEIAQRQTKGHNAEWFFKTMTSLTVWAWQQAESLESYLRRSDPSVQVDRHWPLRPLKKAGGS